MKLAFAGAGFVGIVYGAMMAKKGNSVTIYDIDENKISALNDFCEGKKNSLPIHEEGLPTILEQAYKEGLLRFTTDSKQAISDAEVIFLTVGTPSDAQGRADVRYVNAAAHTIGKVMKEDAKYKLIVTKSTVPVGTAKRLEEIIGTYAVGKFDVASNPETLAEGKAVKDAEEPQRIIVGTESERARRILSDLYAPFFFPGEKGICFMSPESAELTKYACNTYLASQVVLTNMFANLAKRYGANWREILEAIGADPRIGKFVHPGLGFGGSCFKKDVSALCQMMKDTGAVREDYEVLERIIAQNEAQKHALNPLLKQVYGESLDGQTLAVWGLAFKKDTNDVRDAASLRVIPDLLQMGAHVRAHDPKAAKEFLKEIGAMDVDMANLEICKEKYAATEGADGLLIITEWITYRQPDFAELREKMRRRIIFDAKDLMNYQKMQEETDFSYYAIGRPDIVR